MKAFLPVVIVLVALGFLSFESDPTGDVDPYPTASVLFFADTGSHEDAYRDVAASLSWIDWDASIIATSPGGDPLVWQPLAGASDRHFYLSEGIGNESGFEVLNLDGLTVVVLDRTYADPDRCQFTADEIRGLTATVGASDLPVAVVSDFPFWRGIDPPAGESDLVLGESGLVNCDDGRSIVELFEGLPRDKPMVFLSRGGGGVYDVQAGQIRFVQLGTPARDTSAGLTFIRLGISHGKLTVGVMKQSNPNLQDRTALASLPTYTLQADGLELRALYNRAPFYDRRAGWPDLLEDRDFVLPTVAVTIQYEGTTYQGTIRTRGSFGNHWDDIKKSWTIDIPDPGIDGVLQLKLVLPYDRVYTNQLFVQEINRSSAIDIITPEISVGRLVLNGRDFGPYLIYEDFDKAFIETQGFNSDAQRAGLFYRDFFGLYDIWDDPNFITTSPARQDKTRVFPATLVTDGYDEFIQFFEPGNYRPWIASQLYTGDPHQNAQNNTRFFVDFSTGRYIMVSWDQFFAPIESVEKINNFNPTSYLQFEILAREEPAILAIVERLIDQTDEFSEALDDLNARYFPVFANDPYLAHPEARIKAFGESLKANLENNAALLSEYVESK